MDSPMPAARMSHNGNVKMCATSATVRSVSIDDHRRPGELTASLSDSGRCGYSGVPATNPRGAALVAKRESTTAEHLHRAGRRVISSPIDGWIVTIEGWTAPPHFSRTHPDIEAAQRAADHVLINFRPLDCKQCGCGEWVPVAGVGREQRHTTGTPH